LKTLKQLMSYLEPTYLRYVYDGLLRETFQADNAAGLPDGLVGAYDQAFNAAVPVAERQGMMRELAVWALLKKEASTVFVARVLGVEAEHIADQIARFSSWFNSPEPGKYQLYHERLRVYLLQKLSEEEIHVIHEKLIARLEQAIEEQKADEFERYTLEFLTSHLAVAAMLNGDSKKLIDLAYSQTHWQRQLKISKGYTWTKNGLKEVMTWASKYNDDEVIECGLQMVDLYHQEQNAAPQIVALVAEGDFDAALKRIEQFGGNDEEGLQRKFILYMLCLMELTLHGSKDKTFRKEGIEKLLKHLDDSFPTQSSFGKMESEIMKDWDIFFPSFLVFKMVIVWEELGLKYDSILKLSNTFNCEWISDCSPFTKTDLNILLKIAKFNLFESEQENLQDQIFIQFIEIGHFEDALLLYDVISDRYWVDNELKRICFSRMAQDDWSTVLKISENIKDRGYYCLVIEYLCFKFSSKEKIEILNEFQSKALSMVMDILDSDQRDDILSFIYEELNNLNLPHIGIRYAEQISTVWGKNCAYLEILEKYALNGETEKAIKLVEKIQGDDFKPEKEKKILALLTISSAVHEIGNYKECEKILKRVINAAESIDDQSTKQSIFKSLVFELGKQYKSKEALDYLNSISDEDIQNSALIGYLKTIIKQGKAREAIELIHKVNNEMEKDEILSDICALLGQQGETEKAFSLTEGIKSNYQKEIAIFQISLAMANRGEIEVGSELIHSYLEEDKYIEYLEEVIKIGALGEAHSKLINVSEHQSKNSLLEKIAIEYAGQSEFVKVIEVIGEITNDEYGNHQLSTIRNVCQKMGLQGFLNQIPILLVDQIKRVSTDFSLDSQLLDSLSEKLISKSRFFESKKIALLELNEPTETRLNRIDKSIFNYLSRDLFDWALSCVNGINADNEKIRVWRGNALIDIWAAAIRKGHYSNMEKYEKKIIESIHEINDTLRKYRLAIRLAKEFILQKNYAKAHSLIADCPENDPSGFLANERCDYFAFFSTQYYKNGLEFESQNVLIEALKAAGLAKWSDEAYQCISTELVNQGKLEKAIEIASKKIQDASISSSVFLSISNHLILNNEFDKAKSLSQYLKGDDILSYLKNTTQFLFETNRFELAKDILDNSTNTEDKSVAGTIRLANTACLYFTLNYEKKSSELIDIVHYNISDLSFFKKDTLIDIWEVFIKYGLEDESEKILNVLLELISHQISDGFQIGHDSLRKFVNELMVRQKYFILEELINKNPQIKTRILNLLKDFIQKDLKYNGYFKAKRILTFLNISDSEQFFKKGIIGSINFSNISYDIVLDCLKDKSLNQEPLKHLLKLHALNQLFFEELPEEKIQRFNRTLNIQWAIDIKNKLPN
jgi:hypothetical protein